MQCRNLAFRRRRARAFRSTERRARREPERNRSVSILSVASSRRVVMTLVPDDRGKDYPHVLRPPTYAEEVLQLPPAVASSHAACVLLPEARGEVMRILSMCKAAELHQMCEVLLLKKAGNKASLATRVADHLQKKGCARGVVLLHDVPFAIWRKTYGETMTFDKMFIHVCSDALPAFIARPDEAARAKMKSKFRGWDKTPEAYFGSMQARHIAALGLFGRNWDKLGSQCRVALDVVLCCPTQFFTDTLMHMSPFSLPFSGDRRRNAHGMAFLIKYVGGSDWYALEQKLCLQRFHVALVAAMDNSTVTGERPSAATANPASEPPSTSQRVVPAPSAITSAANAAQEAATALNNLAASKSPSSSASKRSTYGDTPEHRQFYARLDKADPMYEMISSNDNPAWPPGEILKPSNVQSMKTFQQMFFLSATDLHFLQREEEFELQAVCMLQNDEVKERLQWPLDVYLTCNDANCAVIRRSTVKSVTKSTRDPAVRIPVSRLRSGSNHIRMFHRDKRGNFMFALRIVRKRTLEEVASVIPKASSEPVALKNALKWLGFKKPDDDDIIMDDVALVSLRCPISGQVCSKPARLASCQGMHTFDAESFLQLCTVSRKWCCPACGKKGGPSDLRIDSFIKKSVEVIKSRNLGDKAGRIEVDKDGRWRPREDPGAPTLSALDMRWYKPLISGTNITWELQEAVDGSPVSTATKFGVSGTNTPNVESAEAKKCDLADDDSESDEEEELRRAIREAEAFRTAKDGPPAKKPRLEPSVDVIVISDDDDDAGPARSKAPEGPRAQTTAMLACPEAYARYNRPKPSSRLNRPHLF